MAKKPDPTKSATLHPAWRGGMAAVGLVLLVLGIFWWASPPERKSFPPQASDPAATAELEAPSETISVLLVGVGAALLLVAANGRRLTSVKIGEQEFSFAEAAAAAAGKKAKKKAKARGLAAEKQKAAEEHARNEAYVLARQKPFDLDLERVAEDAADVAQAL